MYEITESYLQLEKAFAGLAANARNGEVGCMPGVTSNWCGTLWPLGNQLIFNAPITSVADIQARIAAVNQYLASKSKMGVVVVPAQFVSIEFQEACVTAMEREGFVPIMTLMGMAADGLQATSQPQPALEYSHASGKEIDRLICKINAQAYQVLPEWGDNMAEDVLLSGEDAFTVIGYAGGEPVATAITYILDGILYVAFVATLPGHQRKGYAEAVMRRSLGVASRATGLSRTVLHATPVGQPVYERMGYHNTTPFTMYLR
jgi:GNAT superfamily N-acetyltransferase